MVTLAAPRWTKASTLPTTYAPTPSSTTRRKGSLIDFTNYFCTYDFANLLKKNSKSRGTHLADQGLRSEG
ncbi:hypothetical protein ACFX15_006000 [Malus domestica]